MSKILIIDNYDSFTYNVVYLVKQILSEDNRVDVYRNDKISLSEISEYDKIIIGPGPGIPSESGIVLDLIKKYGPTHSILGICLGHQAITEAYQGSICQLDEVYHGVHTSVHAVQQDILLQDVPTAHNVGRYHSWAADRLPDVLEILEQDERGAIMSLRHKTHRVRGVQYHPESIMTVHGKTIMRNYLLNPTI